MLAKLNSMKLFGRTLSERRPGQDARLRGVARWSMLAIICIAVGLVTPRAGQAQCSIGGWAFSPCQATVTVAPGSSASVHLSIQNNTAEPDGTGIYCAATAPASGCSVSPTSVSVSAHRVAPITVTVTASSTPGTGTVTLTTDLGPTATITVIVPAGGPPVSAAPTQSSLRNTAICVASCFDATYAYSTPAYTSLDVARSLTLAYRSALADPRPVVVLDAADTTASGSRQMSVRLWHGTLAATFTNGTTESFFTGAPGNNRLTVQYDALYMPTGASQDSVLVTSYLNDGTIRTTATAVRSLILNESASPLGAGWTLVGVVRGYVQANGDILITDGSGSASYFSKPVGCVTACAFTGPSGDFRTLSGPAPGYTLRSPDGTTAALDANGVVQSVADRFGNAKAYGYTGAYLTTITDPAGLVTTLAYGTQPTSGATVLQSITTPGGRVTSVVIDGSGNLTQIVGPDNQYAFRGDYGANHYLSHWLDRGGNDWNVGYDGAQKLASLTEPAVTADGASVRPAIGFTSLESSTVALPGAGTSINPVPHIDTLTVRARVTNARGYVTSYMLGALGAPTRIEEALGRTTRFTRDYAGRVIQEWTPSGNSLTYSYTGPDLVVTSNQFTGAIVRMDYEPTFHQLTRVYGDADSVWNYWSAGKMDSTRNGTSSRGATRFTYDTHGRVVQSVDAAAHYTNVYYASSGWQNTDSTIVAGRKSSQHFNSWGLVDLTTDPAGHSRQMLYDGLHRPYMAIGTRNDTTTYYYGGDFLTGVQDAKHQLYQFVRNALGWTTEQIDPRGGITYFGFDRDGNVNAVTNRRGQTSSATYDALGHLASQLHDGVTTTYATDPVDLYLAGANGESVDTVKFDPAGRATSEVTVRSGVRYERASAYNVRNQRTNLMFVTQPWGWQMSVGFHYDPMMRLDTLTDVAGGRTAIAYDDIDQPVATTLPNGLVISTPFANISRPGSLTYSSATVNASQGASYAYGLRGELTDRVDPSGASGREFRFDDAGQVTGFADYTFGSSRCYQQLMPPDPPELVCPPASKTYSGSSASYSWDLVGNPTYNNAIVETGNRLTQFGSDSLAFDADGNVIARYRNHLLYQSLSWDALGQLTSVTTNGVTVSFGYDAFGRRIRKTAPGSTLAYIHDGDNVWTVHDSSTGSLVRVFTDYPGVDQPHSVFQGGTISYYLQDALGNVTGLVDNSGNVLNQYTYLPFGARVSASETVSNPLQFAAREYDSETGLYYMRARYYDPSVGRFLSEDPIGLGGGVNPYAYASNAPVDATDPSGLWTDEEIDARLRAPCFMDGTCRSSGGGRGVSTLGFAGDGEAGWTAAANAEAAAGLTRDARWSAINGLISSVLSNPNSPERTAIQFGSVNLALGPVGTPGQPIYKGYIAVYNGGEPNPVPDAIVLNVTLLDRPGIVALLALTDRRAAIGGRSFLRPDFVFAGRLVFAGQVWSANAQIYTMFNAWFGPVTAIPRP